MSGVLSVEVCDCDGWLVLFFFIKQKTAYEIGLGIPAEPLFRSDGHKAASDVRDEFVSVTEKLMDELAQCYNVLLQQDRNNTIDRRPEGDEKWFLENEKTVTQFCRKLAAERHRKDIRDEYNYPKKKGIKDECSRWLEGSTMRSRRGLAIQRLMNAMLQAHADGRFIVFYALALADGRLEAFYDNPNALRDYIRDIGRR